MTAPTNKLDVGAMMTDELKRCPFCGAHATAPQNITPTKRATSEVSCAIFCVAIRRGSRKEVVESWNKRALLSASKPAVMQTGLTRHQCNAIEYFVTQMRDEPTAIYVDMFDAFRDYINSLVQHVAVTPAAPAQAGEPIYQLWFDSKDAWIETSEELYGKQMCKKRIVYAAPQPAQTERALTDAQREAIGWACGASKHSGAPEVASYHQIFEKMLGAAQPASGVDHE